MRGVIPALSFPFIEIIDCLGTTYCHGFSRDFMKRKMTGLSREKTKQTKQNKKLTTLDWWFLWLYTEKTKKLTKYDWFGGYRDCIKTKMTGLVVPVIMQKQKWLAWWFLWLLGSSRDYTKTKITLAWWFCNRVYQKRKQFPGLVVPMIVREKQSRGILLPRFYESITINKQQQTPWWGGSGECMNNLIARWSPWL